MDPRDKATVDSLLLNDPFAAGLEQPGVVRCELGRTDPSENGRVNKVPRSIAMRAAWPLREPMAEVAKPVILKGWPF
jgi:hypothetical protein